LCYAALEHRIEEQNIAALQLGSRTEINFAPLVATVVYVAHVLADKVADDRGVNLANQVGGKNEPAI